MTDMIIKRASFLSTVEQIANGYFGIPADWPIESSPYLGSIPDGFEQITSTALTSLIADNQSAYDAWIASKAQPATPKGSTLIASFFSSSDLVNSKFLSTENGVSDSLPVLVSTTTKLTLLTFIGTSNTPSGTIEVRVNTTTGTPNLSIALGGVQTQVFSINLSVAQGETLNCRIGSDAINVSYPVIKLYSDSH